MNRVDDLDSEAEDSGGQRSRLARILGLLSNIIFIALVSASVAFVAGFIIYLGELATLHRPDRPKADGIIVLTGGYQRIEEAIGLLDRGAARRLLISGVNPATTMAEIQRFTGRSKELFTCCVDIGYDALDTRGNAVEAANWMRRRGFTTAIVVTNDYHVPRSMLELGRAAPRAVLTAWPVENAPLNFDRLIEHPYLAVTLVTEYLKTIAVMARDHLPFDPA